MTDSLAHTGTSL